MNRVLEVGYALKLSGKEFIIKDIVGKGASSVTYLAEQGKTEHILKECNPLGIAMYRTENGELVADTELGRQKFEESLERFKEGADKQLSFRLTEDLKNPTSNIQDIYYANGTAYIDMTYFGGKTYDKVDSESFYDLFRRMKALAQIVVHYHKSGFLHLDIKPQNIYTIPETPEMVMMFDFDSVTPIKDIDAILSSSYTDVWAAPEQKMPKYRNQICEATDFFAIGEIVFYKIFGKHSQEKDRYSFSQYEYLPENKWFENVNPRVFPMITELLHRTLSCSAKKRYKNADQLVMQLDKIIEFSNPKEPFLKNSLPNGSGFFMGRDAEIEEIHKGFQEENVLFLSGLGGIGKSELAKHYAAEHKDAYDAIIFAPYVSDVNMLLLDDNAIPLYNFAPYPEEKPEEYCARKLRKLRELCDERTLFIVDNLDREDDPDINKLLDLGCKLLITTRMDFSDYGYGTQLYLDAMRSRDSILALFHKYYTKPLNAEENACVEQIIDLVAGHTMTVELLAKQMMAGRITPEKMLTKLQEGGISESGKEKVRSGKNGTLSAQSTYAHIQTLFDLSELDEEERYILANLSLIPHTGTSTELFHDWCELEDYECINKLVVEGWVRLEKERDYVSLHPVVADMVGAILFSFSKSPKSKDFQIVEGIFDSANKADFSERTKFAILLVQVTKQIIRFQLTADRTTDFLVAASYIYQPFGFGEVMLHANIYALSVYESMIPNEETEGIPRAHLNVARGYLSLGDLKSAEKHCNECIAFINEHSANKNTLAYPYALLGEIKARQGQGNWNNAKKYLLFSANMLKNLGDNIEESHICRLLALLYGASGDVLKEKEFEKRSIDTVQVALEGDDQLQVYFAARDLVCKAQQHRVKGELSDAEICLKEALEKMLRLCENEDPLLALIYDALGDVYKLQGQSVLAKDFYAKAQTAAHGFYDTSSSFLKELQEKLS